MKGDYDLDAWLDWTKDKSEFIKENERLREALNRCSSHTIFGVAPCHVKTDDLWERLSKIKQISALPPNGES